MHHYPDGHTLDNFAFDRLFQRCYVHRSLSGVAPLLGTANAWWVQKISALLALPCCWCQTYWVRMIGHPPIGPSDHLGVGQQVFLDVIEFEHCRFSRKSP